MIMTKLICDKCGSEDIEQNIISQPKMEPHIPIVKIEEPTRKMTEFQGLPTAMTLEYHPTQWELYCKNCGFTHYFYQ